MDIFDGDPLITMGADGADMVFRNGQPVMDAGLENQVNFAMLTNSGHWSEDLEIQSEKIYTGLLLEAQSLPITRDNLIEVARAAEADAADPVFKKIEAEATNPYGQQLVIKTKFYPISSDPFVLYQEKNGQNWINQMNNPANEKI